MHLKTITFTRLTVGSSDPVAEGNVKPESDGQPFCFSLVWDKCAGLWVHLAPEYYQTLTPTQRKRNELMASILHQKFVDLLYASHGEVFFDVNNVMDAGNITKKQYLFLYWRQRTDGAHRGL